MSYSFKYRNGFFWKKEAVIGHQLNPDLNRMDLFLEDGSIRSIGEWSKYDLVLGTDWVLFTKKKMEEESGQEIKFKSNIGV